MPRSTTVARQKSSRQGNNAVMSGTVGCTSQSMAARAPVMGSSLVVGLDVRRLGDLTPAEHFLAHPGVEFLRRVAGGGGTPMTPPVRQPRPIPRQKNNS